MTFLFVDSFKDMPPSHKAELCLSCLNAMYCLKCVWQKKGNKYSGDLNKEYLNSRQDMNSKIVKLTFEYE